ncbi:GNAT family N-acetyltransferase [Microtetraspora sp. AC03309]|uniref:GNAT family N-acetyltransferase n=1 Tax=Microtetraspora sp. AC03309 TaxID=2779376 RepID=UPI001E5DC2EF|nr:GNAT family N-acetyltransferase [Microtetraspora sp. AC03309]MCC5579351.1 GNAT family N-acetyltransferase [Microtetraspora sp. AC03309]
MDIRDLTADDLDAVLDNRKRAFGPLSGGDAETWRQMVAPLLPEGRYIGAFDGSRLVATARINAYTQWWHGRPMSMAGVAGVTVSPEDRGRGVGRLIMRATIDRAAELGHVVSALYPATTPLYRGMGWEHAGGLNRATLPTETLRALGTGGADVKLRRMGPDDAPELIATMGRVYASTRASGPLCYDERTWRLWLADDDDFCYIADDGFVIYRWSGKDIEVDGCVAGSEATTRALWSLVGTASSIAKSVTACIEPQDPLLWLIRERSQDEIRQTRWMFRLIDLPAAVARRGFPAGVSLDAVVHVEDAQRPSNSGSWRLEVSAGSGTATAVADGGAERGPTFTVGGLSALFAGVPTATLRRTGLVTGGSAEDDEALDSAFRCAAYMIDYF